METVLVIGVGAFVGANLRYWLSLWVTERWTLTFPLGTLIVNFSGSLGLAVFMAWAMQRAELDPRLRVLVATGFFGGYTTFSTYANESVALLRMGDWVGAFGNVIGTNLICIFGVLVGLTIGSRL